MQFLDVVTILLKYCGPKSSEKGETQAVIVDLVATLGFFCANNKQNQVSSLKGFQSSINLWFFLLIEKLVISAPLSNVLTLAECAAIELVCSYFRVYVCVEIFSME